MNSPRSPQFRHADNDPRAPDAVFAGDEATRVVKHESRQQSARQQSALDRYAVMLLTQAPGAQTGNTVDFMNKSSRSKCSSTSSQF